MKRLIALAAVLTALSGLFGLTGCSTDTQAGGATMPDITFQDLGNGHGTIVTSAWLNEVNAVINGRRFQVSGRPDPALVIGSLATATGQGLSVRVPAGKKLVLKRARALLATAGAHDLKLEVGGIWVSGAVPDENVWLSTDAINIDEAPDAILIDNSGQVAETQVTLFTNVVNAYAGDVTVAAGSSWWLDVAIQ
jgi:hypothetical protein